jgi:hypothetical protein
MECPPIRPSQMSGTLFIFKPSACRRTRINRRLRPALVEGPVGCEPLEPRLLLNGSAESSALASRLVAQIRHLTHKEIHHAKAAHPQKRLTPTQKINAAYAAFSLAYKNVLGQYVQAIDEQSSNTVAVSATVTAAYTPPASTIQVDNAAVFGPAGTFNPSVVANAVFGSVSFGQITLLGSSGNQLIIATTPTPPALPVGTVLTASVPTTSQTSAATIFPSYVTNSTIQMAIKLVKYFNSIPIKLPPENAPPHTPVQRGAIQTFVYSSIAGNSPTSLQKLLLMISLPTTTGSDLQIYEAAVLSAIAESRLQLLDGITQIFNRTQLVNALPPANRLGENFNSSSGSSSSGSSSSSSSSSSGSSSTA